MYGMFKYFWEILKSKWAPWILVAILALLFWITSARLKTKSKEVTRLTQNQEALLSDIEVVKGKYSEEVSRVKALELSKNEFEHLYKEQTDLVKSLKLKVGRLETFIETSVVTKDSVIIEVEKPIIVKDSSIIQRPFKFEDKWIDIRGDIAIRGDKATDPATLSLSYEVRDTLDLMVYREPKRFLFIKYGIKRLDCYIYPRNPNSKVVLGSCVVMKKKGS